MVKKIVVLSAFLGLLTSSVVFAGYGDEREYASSAAAAPRQETEEELDARLHTEYLARKAAQRAESIARDPSYKSPPAAPRRPAPQFRGPGKSSRKLSFDKSFSDRTAPKRDTLLEPTLEERDLLGR